MSCTKFILFNSGDTSVNFTYTKCSDNQIETQVELLPNERKSIWAINDNISFPNLFVGKIDIIEKSIFPITPSPTRTPYQQISPRPTKTPTRTPTPTPTKTPTSTPTSTPQSTSVSVTPTPSTTQMTTPVVRTGTFIDCCTGQPVYLTNIPDAISLTINNYYAFHVPELASGTRCFRYEVTGIFTPEYAVADYVGFYGLGTCVECQQQFLVDCQTPSTTPTSTPTKTPTSTPESTSASVTPTPSTTSTPTPSSRPTGCPYTLSSVAEANPSSGNTVWLVSSISGSTTNNPNTINEAYWNIFDSNGTDRTDFFSGFTGTSVFVSFTQNNETAVYSGNTSSFTTWYDTPTNTGFVFSNVSGSTVLITSASTVFNFDETVIINISNNNG